ncbi:protein CANDIDATE G-PROTEIN COUPLED RECEPTOR 7-like [Typha latifolia]|uniref:protein CANDIDATE G-PROTEIN COUPLED RECEPTOR 7-like n=1 Tax=Typha latifolia TaxID=4733 RepID=UPI003C2DBF48
MGKITPFSFLLPFVILLSYLSPSSAEIKTLTISSDSRTLILFEKFGFTPRGVVSISLSSVSVTSSLSIDPSHLGFFLLSDESLLQAAYASEQQQQQNVPGCVLESPFVKRLFYFTDLSPPPSASYNHSFPITHPDEYSLFFANCAPQTQVSMEVRTEMYNSNPDGSKDYLSVGQSPVPSIYYTFAFTYVVFFGVWIYLTLIKHRLNSHRIHHLMSCLILIRSLYLICAAEDQHFIRVTGTPHGWDVLFYVFQLLKGVLLFAVIVLVGTGWSFLKPFLQEKEKKVLMVVIPLQVIANIASVVIGENGPFIRDWVTWNQIFLLIDVACCCAVLFPIIWSIRSLRETSKTDGKAAKNLAKLTLFRQFYIVVIGYLYFTRIIVYALRTIASYKYRWVSVAAEEMATLAFYLVMFYMFRPVERNQYFVLDDDEEEAAEAALREEEFEL